MIDKTLGNFGCRVLRSINIDGKKYCRGAELPAEVTQGWPLKNRRALHSSSKVEFFNPPPGDREDETNKPVNVNGMRKAELIKLAAGEPFLIDISKMTVVEMKGKLAELIKDKGAE